MTSHGSTKIDLFLSYNRLDQDAVSDMCRKLELRGIHTFFDRDALVIGLPWPQALERALLSSRAVAVFLGPHDLGTWQKREMFFALDLQAQAEHEKRQFPVIPVLLKGAQLRPGFLFQNTWVDFRSAPGEAESFESLIRAIDQDARSAGREEPSLCPYLGLRAFSEEDQAFYFGRDAVVDQLVQKLSGKQSILAVVGPSGSGKSSVVMAGLVPRLRRLRSPAWDVISFTPGDHPWLRLAYALAPLLEPDLTEIARITKTGELATALAQCNGTLSKTLTKALELTHGSDRLLVIVDQLEELFTFAATVEEFQDDSAKKDARRRTEFLEELLVSTRSAPVTVLVTLRADYYAQALNASRVLCDALNTGQITLGRMLPEELEQVVEKPLQRVGMQFEPGLVNRMLNDVAGAPGALPILEYALSQLWVERHLGVLTSASYNAFGGVAGAIGDKANQIYNTLSATEQQATRALLGRLVRVSPADTEDTYTRQRATRPEIGGVGWQVALRLAAPGVWLLVTSCDPQTGHEMVEVAHEALIRNWKTLRNWLREDREFLLWRQQLQVFLSIWDVTGGTDETTLLRGRTLDEALKWQKLNNENLNAHERGFITRSEETRKLSYQRHLWVRRVGAAALVIAVITSLASLGYMQTDRYQLNTIIKDAPVQVVNENKDDASKEAVRAYLQALAIYRWEEALHTAQRITDADSKDRALVSIIEALVSSSVTQAKDGKFVEAGNSWQEAHRTAQQIIGMASKHSALGSLAKAQAEAGQFAEAQRMAQQITDPDLKAKALVSIVETVASVAEEQAEGGQFAKAGETWEIARRTAQQIGDTIFKADAFDSIDSALVSIAEDQAKAGQFAEAQRTAQQITDPDSKVTALGSLAKAQAEAGQFAEAQRTAQQINGAYWKATALGSIAEAQAEAGQFAEAQRTAQRITDGSWKVVKLGYIAKAQVKAGKFIEAANTWKEAQRTAQQITDDAAADVESDNNWKARAFASIAEAQAEAGQFAEAQRTMQQVTDVSLRTSIITTLLSVAKEKARAGQIAEAQRLVRQLTDVYMKDTAIGSVAEAQAEAGQFAEAQRTAQQIIDRRSRNSVLESIAKAQAEAGQFAEAQRTSQQITDANWKDIALGSIAQAQAKAGQIAEAQRTAQQITDANWKDIALGSVAEGQAKAGRFAEAQRTAQQITGAHWKTTALDSIAEAQVQGNRFVEAGKTWGEARRAAQQIIDSKSRNSVLVSIAEAQVKAGQFAEAQRTAQRIDDAVFQAKVLLTIVVAQAKGSRWKAARITAESCPTTVRLNAYAAILIERTKLKTAS
jgi:TIR domain